LGGGGGAGGCVGGGGGGGGKREGELRKEKMKEEPVFTLLSLSTLPYVRGKKKKRGAEGKRGEKEKEAFS